MRGGDHGCFHDFLFLCKGLEDSKVATVTLLLLASSRALEWRHEMPQVLIVDELNATRNAAHQHKRCVTFFSNFTLLVKLKKM
jgi:hypothetical protein